jgi:hypothetical protein
MLTRRSSLFRRDAALWRGARHTKGCGGSADITLGYHLYTAKAVYYAATRHINAPNFPIASSAPYPASHNLEVWGILFKFVEVMFNDKILVFMNRKVASCVLLLLSLP